jgi:hypothetical protein
MQLEDCDLASINTISMAPFTRSAPEEDWVKAFNDGAIPAGLYDLYQRANLLSFGAAPRFLSDEENLLFSYFGLVLRSIQEAMADAHQQVILFAEAHALAYDPMKLRRGERCERGADKRERRHFRDLLIALQTALDALADIVAIFYPSSIKGLEVGRAQFSKIETWLSKPIPATGIVETPSQFYLKKLYDAIEPLVRAPRPETDWLPMMRLLRNKAAHLGQPLFRQVGLPGTGDGRFFVFIPRQWPYLWESLIKPAGVKPGNPVPLQQLLRDSLMHQDIEAYSRGLFSKVHLVIAAASVVLNESYDQFKDLRENQAALSELKSNFENYKFETFANA